MSDSPYAAVKIRDFKLFLAARLFVTVAVQIQSVALAWQIYALTRDPLLLGLAGLAEALPSIAISLYAGHVADAHDRRKICIISMLALAINLALLAVCSAWVADRNTLVGIIFCIIAITGIERGFYGPAIFGLVSDILPPNLYANAVAWQSTIWQASAVVGPITGGICYVLFGAAITYAFSTILLIGSLLCFLRIKAKTTIKHEETGNAIGNILDGLKFVFSHEIVLAAMCLDLFAVLFGGVVTVLPMFSSEIFHMGPQGLGVLRAAPCVGAFLTAVVLTHKPITNKMGLIFIAAVAGFGVCMILFGLSTSFYLSLVFLAVSGMLDGISIWMRSTIYQLSTPQDMKGRVAALNLIFIGSSNEIGGFESGVAAKFMGLVPSVIFGGCMTLFVVFVTIVKAPKLRRLNMDALYHKSIEA